jgi:hypothetical protein
MASIDNPRAPAAPMPASPQSKPLGAETRTICTAGWGDDVVVAAGGLRSNRAEAAAGAIAQSAIARASLVVIGRWLGITAGTSRVADHPV